MLNKNEQLNALAHIKVFPAERMLEVDNNFGHGNNMFESQETIIPQKDSKCSSGVNHIWECMGKGLIDISYACVGYSFDGRPVLDYDIFTNLLASYGFLIADIVAFIDEFASYSSDGKSPIVITSINTAKIMTEVTPIVGSSYTAKKSKKTSKKHKKK